jgi:peptidoglycan hydrolase CwlO-like protein
MNKKIYKKLIIVLIAIFLGLFFFLHSSSHTLTTIFAQSSDDLEKQLQAKQDEIKQLQKQLNEARDQEKTLKSELTKIDGQIRLTELKIEEAQFQITKLGKEITDLNGRIDRLSGSVDQMTQLLLTRIVSTYKYSNYDIIDLLFSAHGFSDLLERLKYIQVIQANDKKVLYQLQATKQTYNEQKQDKQIRQAQQQTTKRQMEQLQTQLADQKKQKDDLLRITQNNEKIYQDKIRLAQQEQSAILGILAGAGNESKVSDVSKGENIGNMIAGRSACSSGTHLHFEVHQDNSIKDPNDFLGNTGFSYDGRDQGGSISPHGSWDWPIDSTIYVTQGYGMTPYAKAGAYNGGSHTGIDMYSSSGLGVKAVKSGTLFRGGIACGSGTLLYKKVDHHDGVSSYYLHML